MFVWAGTFAEKNLCAYQVLEEDTCEGASSMTYNGVETWDLFLSWMHFV